MRDSSRRIYLSHQIYLIRDSRRQHLQLQRAPRSTPPRSSHDDPRLSRPPSAPHRAPPRRCRPPSSAALTALHAGQTRMRLTITSGLADARGPRRPQATDPTRSTMAQGISPRFRVSASELRVARLSLSVRIGVVKLRGAHSAGAARSSSVSTRRSSGRCKHPWRALPLRG